MLICPSSLQVTVLMTTSSCQYAINGRVSRAHKSLYTSWAVSTMCVSFWVYVVTRTALVHTVRAVFTGVQWYLFTSREHGPSPEVWTGARERTTRVDGRASFWHPCRQTVFTRDAFDIREHG